MAAAQDKLLRLSSTAFGHVSTDTIINLISNDVGRFEDISRTWVYLWAAPLEALVCTFFIALAVGWIPAIVGEYLAVQTLRMVKFAGVTVLHNFMSLQLTLCSAVATDDIPNVLPAVVQQPCT